MSKWYVKELSNLTGVSVQTLHHYDRIDLLKPSARRDNGYRVYCKADLSKLQQIIALKFFGFELAKIKDLLLAEKSVLGDFSAQAHLLEKKAESLFQASQTLKEIVADAGEDKSIHWKNVIQSIEVYQMTEQLQSSWVKEIFTQDEMKEYATFEAEYQKNSTPEQKADFEKKWSALVAEIEANLTKDPKSDLGRRIGGQCMALVNGVYGKKHAHLRTKKFEQGYGEGKGLDEVGLNSETVVWLDKAIDAYWHDRFYNVLAQVGVIPEAEVLDLWNDVLDDLYGDQQERKAEAFEIALKNDQVSEEAKKWLRSIAQ